MSRQRHVFETARIAHLWMHQTQSEARNPTRNLYFSGDTIFSYGSHFPIARLVKHRGKTAVLFTNRSYSVTTSGHCSMVRHAIPAGVAVFYVYNPQGTLADGRNEHKQNVAMALESLAASKSKPQRAIRYRSLQSVIATANEYYEYFGFTTRYALPSNRRELEANAVAYENSLQQRRESRRAKERKRWAAIEAKRELERQEFAAKMPELIERWHNGENSISIPNSFMLPTLLRIRGDVVETSRGAEFPIAHALKVLPVVKSLIDHGRTYQRNGRSIHLGHYTLDSIDADGNIRAGCHTVKRDEVERLIKQLEQRPCNCKS